MTILIICRYLEHVLSRQLLPEGTRIIRVAPNTPSLVKCEASAYSVGPHTTEDDNCLVERLLSSVGICEKLPEKLLDTVTALAGSGAAFVRLHTYCSSISKIFLRI